LWKLKKRLKELWSLPVRVSIWNFVCIYQDPPILSSLIWSPPIIFEQKHRLIELRNVIRIILDLVGNGLSECDIDIGGAWFRCFPMKKLFTEGMFMDTQMKVNYLYTAVLCSWKRK
jgi:hypothetical protein